MILFIILVIVILLFINKEKFSNFDYLKYCLTDDCQLPNGANCTKHGQCNSKYCSNGKCSYSKLCGVINKKYQGKVLNVTNTPVAYECNNRCSDTPDCKYWTWNNRNNLCILLKNKRGECNKSGYRSGSKDECSGRMKCTICMNFNNNCNSDSNNINVCSFDNKRIINSSHRYQGNNVSYLNDEIGSKSGEINCARKKIVNNTTIEKCQQIMNELKSQGNRPVGYTISYPYVKQVGWCGPDSGIITTNNVVVNTEKYQTISNINKDLNGSLKIYTNLNPEGITIGKNKSHIFENAKYLSISNYNKGNKYKLDYVNKCDTNQKTYWNFSNYVANPIYSQDCKESCSNDNKCDAYLINPENRQCYNYIFKTNNVATYNCNTPFGNGQYYGNVKKTSNSIIKRDDSPENNKSPICQGSSDWMDSKSCKLMPNTKWKSFYKGGNFDIIDCQFQCNSQPPGCCQWWENGNTSHGGNKCIWFPKSTTMNYTSDYKAYCNQPNPPKTKPNNEESNINLEVQKVIKTRTINNKFVIYTVLNPQGIIVPIFLSNYFVNADYIYISPYKGYGNKYPNCLYDCLKDSNCGGVRWLNKTKDCVLLRQCDNPNLDKRWRHWKKENINRQQSNWGLQGKGSPSSNPKKIINKNISLGDCQLRCEQESNCNTISYNEETGQCSLYNRNTDLINSPDKTYTLNTFY